MPTEAAQLPDPSGLSPDGSPAVFSSKQTLFANDESRIGEGHARRPAREQRRTCPLMARRILAGISIEAPGAPPEHDTGKLTLIPRNAEGKGLAR